ncbi:MAG: adenylate/guanylate cyclase domain-containing protein, partial [Anaerolineae bacterium]
MNNPQACVEIMTDLLQTFAAYVPPDIIRVTLSETSPAPPTEAQADRFPAAILFADVSGFTPLTEALAQKGAEGPEELTRLLNGYFSRMIALIEAQGGEVVKFSGDAVTVVFPGVQEDLGIATRRARQAAEAMQAAMDEFATLETSAGPVALGMKIGIGAGEIIAAHVGGVFGRWEYVIAGDPLLQVAQAEHQASRGEIVLSPEAEAIIVPHVVVPRPLSQPDWARVQNPAAVEAVLRAYVPGVVSTWLEEALQEWLAVLRPMSVLFIGIAGIDYTQADAIERLHAFLRAAQEIVRRYEGSVNKLAVDDKGTISIILFGAPPRAHENDPERALRCALDLQALAETQELELAIGVTTGRVFAGPVGSETRREYTVMGDTVNLAARLMGVAGPGQVRCDYETYRSTRGKLAFDLLPSVRVKGKAGLIRIYRPTGEAGKGSEGETGGVLVGRRAEVARFVAGLNDVHAGRSRILLVEGEAGIGKSRLVQELIRLMRERGIAGLLGMGRSIEQQTPYRAWREIFISYFDLEEVTDPVERRHRVQTHVRDVAPDLEERIPLLNDVLNLGFPENELTASLDTHLRHESLVSLLLALLRVWAAEEPLVLVLEDAQWLDSLSWDLTLQVARALTVARVPLLLVVVMRPLEGEVTRIEAQTLAGMDEVERLLLESMSPEEILMLAAAKLGVTGDGLPEPVAELVRTRADGNPFFAEELVYALRDNDLITIKTEAGETRCLVSGDLDRAAQTLPDTIQGIVLSRIDRLRPEEQLTLKVAAVIGRTF